MRNKTRKDPYTGETFQIKRRNQRFATRQNRIDFNNEKAAVIRDIKAPFNSPLHKNLLILLELMQGKKEATFHKQFLLGRGFSFQNMTNSDEYNGEYVFAAYGYLWLQVVNDKNQLTDYIKIIIK